MLMKVKTILVSQPEPKVENSPYFDLIDRQKVKIDFVPFIHVEGVSGKQVRSQKVDLTNYTAIILTSRNAVDHFFRIADELRFKVPDTMKYFCQSEAVAYYLQKYVVYRKRKIYVGKRTFTELSPLIKKYKTERFLLPASDKLKPEVPRVLNELNVQIGQNLYFTKPLLVTLVILKMCFLTSWFSLAQVVLSRSLKTSQISNKMIRVSPYLGTQP